MWRKEPAYQRRLFLSLWTAARELKAVRPNSFAAFLDGSKRSVFFETNRVDIIAGEGEGNGEIELTDAGTHTSGRKLGEGGVSSKNEGLGGLRLSCCWQDESGVLDRPRQRYWCPLLSNALEDRD